MPVLRTLADQNILGGVGLNRLYPGREDFENHMLVAVTETVTMDDVEALASALEEILP